MSALIQGRLTPQVAHEAMITARRYGTLGTIKDGMYGPALAALRG
jgi:hypothetical protein